MARRHVVQYFLEMENQYLEMLSNIPDYKELLAENQITQDEYESLIADVELIKSNYERLAYIMMLLNKPNKSDKREKEINKSWYDALKTASKEALINENADALAHIKSILREKKKND